MLKIDSVLKRKSYKDLEISDKQRIQLSKIIDYRNSYENGSDYQKSIDSFVNRQVPKMIESGVDFAFVPRFKRNYNINANVGLTQYKCLILYGKYDKMNRWNNYCNIQSDTNSFEYKHKKYGMSREQFNEYNKSRSITLENMIKKHGKDDGINKFNEYRRKQSYAGCAKEYFIEKYGNIEGVKKYVQLNLEKSHSLEGFKIKYGNDEGVKKYKEYMESIKCNYSSKEADEFFNKFIEILKSNSIDISHIYTNCINREFGSFSMINESYYFYDFVDTKNKICIEFNGDDIHGNPKKYNENDVLEFYNNRKLDGITAIEKWNMDRIKLDWIRSLGYMTCIIWESDAKDYNSLLNLYEQTYGKI